MTTTRSRLSIRVVSNRDEARRFVHLPVMLHGRVPQWAPTGLRRDALRQLDRDRHPFYRHSAAQWFLATRNGTVVGRIGAIDHVPFNRHHGSNTAFFGNFDCVDDADVSGALFEAAMEWASGRGRELMTGPRGIAGFDGTVLVDGFEHASVAGVPWNPPFVGGLIESAGFAKYADYLSGSFPGTHDLDPRIYAIARRVRERSDIEVHQPKSRRDLRMWIDRALPVYLETISQMPGYTPATPEEVAETISTLMWIADPRGITIITAQGVPIGFLFAYPDVATALRSTGGRTTPAGVARLVRTRSSGRRWIINGLGVVESHRGTGASALLYTTITRLLTKTIGVDHVEVVHVGEENHASRTDMEKLDVRWYKRHRHYGRGL